jgi:hypothetical protein
VAVGIPKTAVASLGVEGKTTIKGDSKVSVEGSALYMKHNLTAAALQLTAVFKFEYLGEMRNERPLGTFGQALE